MRGKGSQGNVRPNSFSANRRGDPDEQGSDRAGPRGGHNVARCWQQIADELSLSVEGVKTQIQALFEKLSIEALPQNQKRAELARRALASGLLTQRHLRM
jgi:hypothetical protein